MENLKSIIATFYSKCLTVNPETDVAVLMSQILDPGFQSKGSDEVKSREHLIGQIQFFWNLVPDLKWEVQEMVQDGNKVVVRSLVSGTPNGNFMGTPTNGTRSFKTMTIDIHTIENGQVVEVYHLEDWATAIRQLSAS